jgi:hypothetical protein
MFVLLGLEGSPFLFYLFLYLSFYLLLLLREVFEVEEEGHGWELFLPLGSISRPDLVVVHEGHPFSYILEDIISNAVIGILNLIENILS